MNNKIGITLVEIIIYLFIVGVLVGGCYQGYLFFYEWKCNKNISTLNNAIEQYITESRKPLNTLEDLEAFIKGKKIPYCKLCPSGTPYLLEPEEKRVRCAFHGF